MVAKMRKVGVSALLGLFLLAAVFSVASASPGAALDSCANDPCTVGSTDCGESCFCHMGACQLNGMCDDMPCRGEAPNQNCDFSNGACHCNKTLGKCVADNIETF